MITTARPTNRTLLALVVAFYWVAPCAIAAPYTYKEANNYSAQLQRAFATAPTTSTAPVYRSSISRSSPTSTSSSGSSRSGSGGGFGSGSDSYSWGMPTRQPAFDWGRSVEPKPDPDGDKIRAAQLRTWALPVPPQANAEEITRYYESQGVSASRAIQAAQSDLDDHRRVQKRRENDANWAAYDREQRRISEYLTGQKAGRAAYQIELRAVRARALASGGEGNGAGADRAAATAWFDLAGTTQMWRGTYIEVDPLARREAVFFAARAGVARAILSAWSDADNAGENAEYWRAQSVLLGDTAALAAVYKDANKNPDAGFARAAALFERAFQIFPATPSPRDRAELVGAARAQCAFYLTDFYARGAADLPADPARALAWAKKVPGRPPAGWQDMGVYYRPAALKQLEANILTVRAVEAELLAEWETLLKTNPVPARDALYPIYLGRNPAFVTSVNAAKARALFPNGPDDLTVIIAAGDWPSAAKFEDLPFSHDFRLPFLLGRLWRERTDGKRDLPRARVALEEALSNPKNYSGNGEAAIALSEIQLELGDKAGALRTLEKTAGGWPTLTRWRAELRLALGYYRGEFGEVSEEAGDQKITLLAKATATPPGQFRDQEEKFVREFEFQRIAAPLLTRFTRLEAARSGSDALSPEGRDEIARRHRENFAAGLPRLRAIAFSGYAPATRLWAMLTLSNYAAPSQADAALAKNFLFQSAYGGDAPAVSVLAQRLFLDAQQARLKAGSADKLLLGQFGEAADWLEASLKSGDDGALWPLYMIYSEGLGRPPSQQKADEFLETLALKEDPEAVALVAKSGLSALGEKPAAKPVGASR